MATMAKQIVERTMRSFLASMVDLRCMDLVEVRILSMARSGIAEKVSMDTTMEPLGSITNIMVMALNIMANIIATKIKAAIDIMTITDIMEITITNMMEAITVILEATMVTATTDITGSTDTTASMDKMDITVSKDTTARMDRMDGTDIVASTADIMVSKKDSVGNKKGLVVTVKAGMDAAAGSTVIMVTSVSRIFPWWSH